MMASRDRKHSAYSFTTTKKSSTYKMKLVSGNLSRTAQAANDANLCQRVRSTSSRMVDCSLCKNDRASECLGGDDPWAAPGRSEMRFDIRFALELTRAL